MCWIGGKSLGVCFPSSGVTCGGYTLPTCRACLSRKNFPGSIRVMKNKKRELKACVRSPGSQEQEAVLRLEAAACKQRTQRAGDPEPGPWGRVGAGSGPGVDSLLVDVSTVEFLGPLQSSRRPSDCLPRLGESQPG